MNMISTRDPKRQARSYMDVLLEGLAPDGGLYVPEAYPRVTTEELESLKGKSYFDVAFLVKKKLIGERGVGPRRKAGASRGEAGPKVFSEEKNFWCEIPDATLRTFIDRAYASPKFSHTDGNVAPISRINGNLYLQELSLGPTAAFKDMAMQLLGQEMEYELANRNETLTILAATSGDTGSAAEAAFKGLERVKLFMLSPFEGMSAFQRAQMGALSGGNIVNISVRGKFDDCQDLVKKLKQEPEFGKLGAVNSINWGRISSQVPYYFSGYLQAARHIGDSVDVCVPSGNFGNVLSAYIAKRMGLPIRKLIVATNENNVLERLFTTGVYAMTPAQTTSSPSMDISKASNYERLVFDVLKGDGEKVRAYMKEFEKTGRVDFKDYGVTLKELEELGFVSGASSHAQRLEEIRRVYEETAHVIDPHTADAVSVARRFVGDAPCLCMSTALAVKFELTIQEALGFVPEKNSRFAFDEKNIPEGAFTVIDPDAEALRVIIRSGK